MKSNLKYTTKNLEIIDLNFEKQYQRKVSDIKVNNIFKNFNWYAFNFCFVNIRDGKYYVVDGQHRIVAAVRHNHKSVPCMITEGLTIEEEAELFLYYQTNRNSIRAYEKYNALLTSNDPDSLKIQNILEKYNLIPTLGRSTECNRKKGYINGLGAINKIYKNKGEKWLDYVLDIITDIWKFQDGSFDPDALTSNIFSGMHLFLTKTFKILDRPKFIIKLKKISASKILSMGNRNQVIYGRGKAANIARAILEEYNNKNQKKLNVTI